MLAENSPQSLQARIKLFVEQLAGEVETAKSSDALLSYLRFAAAFREYSLCNTLLIFSQMPTATHVMGFHGWRKLGRSVKKGEHGIAILAPVLVKKKQEETDDEKNQEVVTRFKTVFVFDQSQTEGEDLPSSPVLTGATCPDDLALALVLFADEHDIKVKSDSLSGGAYGVSRGGEVVIDADLEGADHFAVLCHEIGHELLNHRARRADLSKQERETEAETVAYVVCQHFGVATTSPAYLALYSADGKSVMSRLEIITTTIQQIIAGVEDHLGTTQEAANQ